MYDLRQAAIEYFQRIIDATNTDGSYNLGFIDGLEFCINHLSTMPPAQPEQKGKWIVKTEGPYLDKIGYCSRCRYATSLYQFFDHCPHCGAEMEEEV